MRVIAGMYRSRTIAEVKGDATRPTTDKNREMLFNILGQFFEGGTALDLFSGSGAIGIECLSRGIASVDFVDSEALAIQTIRKNLTSLEIAIGNQAFVHKDDALRFLSKSKQKYDLIIADPPYRLGLYPAILEAIGGNDLLGDTGILVLESDKSETIHDTSQLAID
ncbi:MAG: 16S rRNA (guanine(966)-N(2))-methyltransferase RsmD [Bacillus subtilis]|nr:16S rRNA (guanine(966)-N(2))-methyltransferase RsmD [Bacillus subtilis]